MPSKSFLSSLKRQVRICRLRIIKSFHLLPIKATVVATGQAGLDAWKDYVESLGKPMNDIFIVCHPAGASYIKGMNVYGTEGAQNPLFPAAPVQPHRDCLLLSALISTAATIRLQLPIP